MDQRANKKRRLNLEEIDAALVGAASDKAFFPFPWSSHNDWTTSFMPYPPALSPALPTSTSITHMAVTPRYSDQGGAEFLPHAYGVPEAHDEGKEACVVSLRSPEISPVENTKLVCFGRITSISGKWKQNHPNRYTSEPFFVDLLPEGRFCTPGSGESCGQVLPEYTPIISGLLGEDTLRIYTYCLVPQKSYPEKQQRASFSSPCELEITIYGPEDLFNEIGSWFQECDVYLQDPVKCDLDVLYLNPHRLSAESPSTCLLVSEFIAKKPNMGHLLDIPEQPDMLDIISSHISLREADQPFGIRTLLKSHQAQALTFMFQREVGWSFDRSQPDMWELVENNQSQFFVNRISEATQMEEPPNFSGGIIADPMGFGKTLTMIALVATDLHGYIKPAVLLDDGNRKPAVSATLIIIPPPLIGSWEEQLDQHVLEKLLICRRHHGKTKITSTEELQGVHIVLTSYHTVSAEWKEGHRIIGESQSVLFSVRWRRIILDEAHFIRNGNSKMAKATCSLDGVSRWAVTGTPVQNRLGDLAALLTFIRAYPYNDPNRFDQDISHFWKSGEDEKAATRLKNLSSYLVLRRPRKTITLPRRVDTKCCIDLYPAERQLYNKIREQVILGIDAALQGDLGLSRTITYVNALQKIESLRLVCNLGLHYYVRTQASHTVENDSADSRHIARGRPREQDDWTPSLAQKLFNMQRDMGPIACLQCSSTLDLMETLLLDDTSSSAKQSMALFSRCLKFMCPGCAKTLPSSNGPFLACGDPTPCPTAPVSISPATLEDATSIHTSAYSSGSMEDAGKLPSKVEALMTDLKSLPPGTKCIVFSTWRLTLDIIQTGLDQIPMKSVRFDGRVPQKERQAVVERFRADPNVRVMLLTLSCGAVGLTLTEATRAYLMEPHWNPTLEEQALARIHRLGQTKEVTTVRFFVRDSFEEQVIKLQESKKQLASVLLSHHDNSNASGSLEGLHKLRSLL